MPFGLFGKKTQAVEGTEVTPPSSEHNIDEKNVAYGDVKATGNDGVGVHNNLSEAEANRELKFLKKLHRWDPNLSQDVNQGMSRAARDHDATAELELINLIENDSPYPEVRAAVRNWDEDLPTNTVRAWVLGMILVTVGSGMNMLFSLRSPSISITSFVAQLVAYPMGLGWDLIMPKALCPGKFNMKEHTLIVIMANVSFAGGAAYSTDTIVALKAFYGYDLGWGFQIVLTLTTQMIGFGYAGLLRKFLVWPASMIWPTNFVNTSLFYALHDHSKTDPAQANGWSIGRYRYFLYVFLGSFVWYWFPGWIFQALSLFAFATWIAPDNVIVNQVFGFNTGLGLIPITFDWTEITGFTLSPLMFPWHAIANTLIGVVLWFLILTPALHFSGWGYAQYLPISSSSSYDNTGNGSTYQVKNILTPEYTLDIDKYEAYSPLFLSTTFALAYGLSFASILSLVTHTALFHGQEIWIRARLSLGEEPDVHTKMMRKYPEAPWWWFGITFVVMLGLSFFTCLYYPTLLTAWALIIALIIAGVFSVPIGMIQAITNVQLGLNVITEFIIGYMQPGRPLAMMLFKTYGYITMTQALTFAQDLKLGHYMKVPPRTLFWGQMVATMWASIVQVAVLMWSFGTIKDICVYKVQSVGEHYTCPGGRVFFNASVIWGLIGPQRIFGPGQLYNGLMYFFIAGAIAPPAVYLLARMFPKSNIRYINMPLVFGGSGQIPPASPVNYTSWGFVGFIFNKVIKNKYRGWWSNYNYVTSAGLDTGLAVATIIIFLTLNLTNASAPDWWGNTFLYTTQDLAGPNIQTLVPEGETFGPALGSF